MVRIVRFIPQTIQRRQRKGIHVVIPIPILIIRKRWRQTESLAEIKQDVGCLGDQEVAVPEDRWGEGRGVELVAGVFGGDLREGGGGGAGGVGDVCVRRSAGFEEEADVFAAAGDASMVT